MQATCFKRFEGPNFNREKVATFDVEVPNEVVGDIEQLMAWIWENVGYKGSHRSGIFEIQLDTGIWSNEAEVRLNKHNAQFTPWEE